MQLASCSTLRLLLLGCPQLGDPGISSLLKLLEPSGATESEHTWLESGGPPRLPQECISSSGVESSGTNMRAQSELGNAKRLRIRAKSCPPTVRVPALAAAPKPPMSSLLVRRGGKGNQEMITEVASISTDNGGGYGTTSSPMNLGWHHLQISTMHPQS